MSLNIREAVPADASIIAEFNARLASETENRELDQRRLRRGVEALLGDPRHGRYWVAEIGDRIVGQIMTTYEWSDWRNGMLWWIQSVYVDGEFRRQGVFTSLFRHVESLARQSEQVCGIRLYVEVENVDAQQTYVSLGMRKPRYEVMEIDFSKESERIDAGPR